MEMLVTKFSKGKYRNESELFAEAISNENVKLMGEMIALQALRTVKKFDMKVADKLYIGLIKDLHHMGEIDYIISDGYDCAQTAMCFLYQFTGRKVSEIYGKDKQGKEITIKVQREFETKPLEKKAIREKIQLPSVPYSGMVNDTTGYIYLTSFTDKSAADVRSAIISLKNKGASSLILDLRGNSGGLLDQAVEIVNFFVPKNSKIVDTKGKVKQWDKEYTAKNNPIVPDMPLVVLIDRGSASASEIVSGALQDLDRAVLIGERSYGKGLVQTVRDLAYNTKLKVTTAKYYIPSGRCIQAVDYSHRNPDGSVGTIPDSLMKPFKTKAGRTVYDGGGITPDVKIEPEKYAKVTQELVLQDMIFDFVNEYAATHPTIAAPSEFVLSDELFNEFKEYLKKREFEYETASQLVLERLVKATQDEKYYDQVSSQVEQLKNSLGHSIDRDLDVFKKEISDILSDQLMERYYMQEGVIEYHIRNDKDIAKALEVLSNNEEYQKILK